jgi:hypothetical protein
MLGGKKIIISVTFYFRLKFCAQRYKATSEPCVRARLCVSPLTMLQASIITQIQMAIFFLQYDRKWTACEVTQSSYNLFLHFEKHQNEDLQKF